MDIKEGVVFKLSKDVLENTMSAYSVEELDIDYTITELINNKVIISWTQNGEVDIALYSLDEVKEYIEDGDWVIQENQ